jgi:hypothetical protein
MPKKQRSIKYRDEVKAAVYSMSNKEAAKALRGAQMAEENARARAKARAEARAKARAEARAVATEARRPGLEKFLENKFGNFQDVYNDVRSRDPDVRSRDPDVRSRDPDVRSRDPDVRSRDPDMMLSVAEMTPEFQQLTYPAKSKAAKALKNLEGLPSGKSWLPSSITKRPYSASIKYRNNPGSSRDASGRKLYKTRNKKSRRGRRGKRTRRARRTRRTRRSRK